MRAVPGFSNRQCCLHWGMRLDFEMRDLEVIALTKPVRLIGDLNSDTAPFDAMCFVGARHDALPICRTRTEWHG